MVAAPDEPNSNDCKYSQLFRHIQYKRTAATRVEGADIVTKSLGNA
jgi:hypothetical protein